MRIMSVIFAVIILGAASALKHQRNVEQKDERDWGYFASSVSRSKAFGLFKAEFDCSPRSVTIGEATFAFESAWLERQSQWHYDWIWFFRPIPTDDLQLVITSVRKNEGPRDYFRLDVKGGSVNGDLMTGKYCILRSPRGLDQETIEIECSLGARKETVRLKKRQPNQALQTTPMTRTVDEKTTEFGRP